MGRFSDIVMDHFQSPRNYGVLECPDRIGVAGAVGRGRFLVLYLRVSTDRIEQATFQCNGCGATIAAGSLLTEQIIGQRMSDCSSFSAEQLLSALGGLPPDKRDRATFAVHALQHALSDEGIVPKPEMDQ